MSNNQKNLLSFLMGCVLAFGFMEILFRLPIWLNDPLFPFMKLNAYSFQDEDDVVRYAAHASGGHLRWDGEHHLVHANHQGFRGDPVPEHEPVSVLLGDSVIFNGGVTQEQALDALLTESTGMRFLNFGVSGTSLFHYEQRFKHDVISLEQVKRVYVCFYLNDFIRDPVPPFLRSNSRKQYSPAYDFHSYALAHFGMLVRAALVVYQSDPALFAWIQDYHQGKHRKGETEWHQVREGAKADWGSAWEPERWPEFDQRIGRMSEMAKSHGIELVVVLFPVKLQVQPDFISPEMVYPQRRAQELAAKWDVEVMDLLPVFRSHQGNALFFDHCHLTPTGNQLVAHEIEKVILSAGSGNL